jgi:ABC-type branched-subunit amino acid transport system permease subunit
MQDFALRLAHTFLLWRGVGGPAPRAGVVQGGILFAVLPTLLDRAHENLHWFPFTALKATWEPAIGALLLLLTLTTFPGGIAQQQWPLLRWLRGGPFRKDPDAFAAQGGGMGVRP